jgi:tetratricopeptide (TPR) repeat protein
VAMFGFPGHDNVGLWPQSDTAKVAATFHDGVISRISDFYLNPDVPHADLLQLQYTMSTWGGYSGSPIFLPNGHVVAAHNMARYEENNEEKFKKSIAHGVRSDLVLEMLVHYGLADKVPFAIDKAQVDVSRWINPDEKNDKLRANMVAATKLVDEAHAAVAGTGDLAEAGAKCNEAIKLVPSYAKAFRIRCVINGTYYARHWRKLPDEDAERILRKCVEDAIICTKLVPSNQHTLHALLARRNLAFLHKDQAPLVDIINTTAKLLGSPNISTKDRAFAYTVRGGAFAQLDRDDDALECMNEAVRLEPEEAAYWEDRAAFFQSHRRLEEAEQDRAKAKEIRERKAGKLPPPPPVPGF